MNASNVWETTCVVVTGVVGFWIFWKLIRSEPKARVIGTGMLDPKLSLNLPTTGTTGATTPPSPLPSYWGQRRKNLWEWFEKKTIEVEKEPHLIAYPFIYPVLYLFLGFSLKFFFPSLYEPWEKSPWLFWGAISASILLFAAVRVLKKTLFTGMTVLLLLINLSAGYINYKKATSWSSWMNTLDSWMPAADPEVVRRRLDDPVQTPQRTVIAKPGVWSEAIPTPPFYDMIYLEHGKIKVEITYRKYENGSESICTDVLEDGPGDAPQWRPQNIFKHRFMSLENHEVEIETHRYKTTPAQTAQSIKK